MAKNLIERAGGGGSSSTTVINKEDMYYDEKTKTWKKKEAAPAVDTSYGANTGTGVQTVTPAPTPPVDTSYAANSGATAAAPAGIQQVGGHEVSSSGDMNEGFNKPTPTTSTSASTGIPGIEQVGGHQVVDGSGQITGTTPLDKQTGSVTSPIDTSYAANEDTPISNAPAGVHQVGGHDVEGSGQIVNSTPAPTPPVDTSYAANGGGAFSPAPNQKPDLGAVGNLSSNLPGQSVPEIPQGGANTPIGSAPTIDTSYGSNTGTPGTNVTPSGGVSSGEQTGEAGLKVESAFSGTTPVDSYDEYMRRRTGALKDIHDATGKFYDEQEQKSLDAIEEQRQADRGFAEDQKAISEAALGESVTSANTYADEQLAAALGFSQQQFDELVSSLNNQYNISSEELLKQKQLFETLTEEQKAAVYDYADKKKASDIAYAKDQHAALVAALTKAKEEGTALAGKELADFMALNDKQKEAIITAANEDYDAAMAHVQERYNTVVDALAQSLATGTEIEESLRDQLLSYSEETRAKIYEAAERKRQRSYESADIERERGVVDARSSYEQRKASYGANAEAIAGMGLAGSGFSDRHDMAAYAQQRAETQRANASAAAVKRAADAEEEQSKLAADTDHIKNKFTAESEFTRNVGNLNLSYQENMLKAKQEKSDNEYLIEDEKKNAIRGAESEHEQRAYDAQKEYDRNIYDINTSYDANMYEADRELADREKAAGDEHDAAIFDADERARQNKYTAESEYSKGKADLDLSYEQNMLGAKQQKAAADYDAESLHRSVKHDTEQARIAEQAGIDLSYGKNIHDADTAARADRLATEQAADVGRFDAEISYRNNMLNNDDTIAAYRQQKEDEALAKIEAQDAQNKELYLKLFDLAKSGSYTAEDIAVIAQTMGLSDARSSGGGSVLSSIYDVANTTQQQISDENKAAELEKEKVTNAKNAAVQLQLIGSESQYELQQIAAMNGMDLSEIQSMAKAASGETVKYHVNNGNIESAVQTIEAAYKNGNMSTSEYQEGYFNIGVGLANMLKGEACTIENLSMITSEFSRYSKEGKITQADYNALVSYAFKKAGTQFDGVENFNISLGVCSFTLGGKKYDLHLVNKKATDNTSAVLDRYYSSNPGTIVCFNGAMYLRGDDVWYAPDITFGAGLYNNDELYEDLRRKSASSASPNEPTYTKSTTTK